MLGQPGGHRPGAEHGQVQVEALARGGGLRRARGSPGDPVRQRRGQALAQHAELQGVEKLVNLLPVPWHRAQLLRACLERDVTGQLRQLPVAQHVAEVLAELVTRLALDLADPVHQLRQRAELRYPLGRRLLADAGDAGQVVARVTAQGREVRVLDRGQPVLLHDRLGGEPGHVADPTAGHQHRHVIGDQLQRVPVAGHDQHAHAVGRALGGQRRDDVVGLVAGQRQPPDPERVQHLEDEGQLPAEVRRGLPPVRLVLDILLVPERRLAPVERHRHMGRPLIAQHVDEHRGEAVDGVGRLPRRSREVLSGQREKRSVGEGMPIEQKQPVALRVRICRPGRVLGSHP